MIKIFIMILISTVSFLCGRGIIMNIMDLKMNCGKERQDKIKNKILKELEKKVNE